MSAEEQQFTALYDAKLAELTFNSKPIINALTMIAGANVKFADRVVALIRKRIVSELIAERRLPYIYVMDSILKNIRGAYMVSFGDVAVEIISSTYDAAPAVIKEKLVRLVRTWIDAKLFSTAILDRIQDGIGQRIDASVPLVPSTPVPPPTAATDAQKRSSAAALAAADAAAFEAKRRRIEAQKAPPINPALWAELEERVRQRPELAPLLEDIRHWYTLNFYSCNVL
jgi:pre-mRNA cleavage complex 2 protein Pcf11